MDIALPSKTWAEAGWDPGAAAERLAGALPGAILETVVFRSERTLVVDLEQLVDALAFLRDDPELQFDFLTDVTAVHWPGRAEPFDVVYHLYSFPRNVRLRVKVRLGDGPAIPTVVPLWPAAGWLERECFDMFGIVFEGHPDLRRILMPEDFDGHPLRKEFPLKC
jgi:NADH-quinone oxidoreductase subunit C